jgi:hypothetical protein
MNYFMISSPIKRRNPGLGLVPVILAIQETEIRRIKIGVGGQSGQKVSKT